MSNLAHVPALSRRATKKRTLLAVSLASAASATLLAGSASGSAPSPPGWNLEWSDDFNGPGGTLPSAANWQMDTGHGYPGGGPGNWGTGELQNYTSSTNNLRLDGNGNLLITPQRDGAGNWTSGRIETRRADFKPPERGTLRMEARIRMPDVSGEAALGYWPAFWALGSPYRSNFQNWPATGELDMMENVNGINSVWGVLHCGMNPGGPCNETQGVGANQPCPNSACQAEFHTYRLEWDRSATPNQLQWYVDDQPFHTVRQDQVDAATWSRMTDHGGYFLLLNVAMGGSFPDGNHGAATPTPATLPGRPMVVDYVGVWTRSGPGGGTTTSTMRRTLARAAPDPGRPPMPAQPTTPAGPATQYLGAEGGGQVTLPPAGGANHDGTPNQPLTFTTTGITRKYNGKGTEFDLFVDSGTAVANGQQIQVSYDLTGDGSWDRVETYQYFATDPVPGFENYTQAKGVKSATGSFGDMHNGRVKVEVWSAIGNDAGTLGISHQSRVDLPFN